MLENSELRLHMGDNEVKRFAQGEGYLQVGGNRAMLLLEEAVAPGDLDVSVLRERLQRAEEALTQAGEGTEEQRRAQRDKRRWETFLGIAESR